MTGYYTFYVNLPTTGSDIETIRVFPITTNAPGLLFSTFVEFEAVAYLEYILKSDKSPGAILGEVVTTADGSFNRYFSMSGSWVGTTLFEPYAAVNLPDNS